MWNKQQQEHKTYAAVAAAAACFPLLTFLIQQRNIWRDLIPMITQGQGVFTQETRGLPMHILGPSVAAAGFAAAAAGVAAAVPAVADVAADDTGRMLQCLHLLLLGILRMCIAAVAASAVALLLLLLLPLLFCCRCCCCSSVCCCCFVV